MNSLALDVKETWITALPDAKAAADEDFFDAGGTSIVAATLIQALRDRLGVRVPLMLLFESPKYADFLASVASFVAANAQVAESSTRG